MPSASPEEFVNLFKYAEMVITNSFHGTAFSIVYEKQFFTIVNHKLKGQQQLGSRVIDLLNKLKLTKHLIEVSGDCDFEDHIEYEKCDEILESMKQESKQFLDKALERK